MSKDFVSYDTAPATRSSTMRYFALGVTLVFALLLVAGCKSQQQAQKENAADLQAQWKALDEQYKKECYDPYSSFPKKQSVQKSMTGAWTKADDAAFQKEQAETKARVASTHCQTLETKRKDVGNRAIAATP